MQESLTNIAKHAMATQINIKLGINDKQRLFLEITDNGKGFDIDKKRQNESYGLIGMKERAYLLDGDFSVISSPGTGTTVKIEIDYPE
jgi:signal transduction histidine kinase